MYNMKWKCWSFTVWMRSFLALTLYTRGDLQHTGTIPQPRPQWSIRAGSEGHDSKLPASYHQVWQQGLWLGTASNRLSPRFDFVVNRPSFLDRDLSKYLKLLTVSISNHCSVLLITFTYMWHCIIINLYIWYCWVSEAPSWREAGCVQTIISASQ